MQFTKFGQVRGSRIGDHEARIYNWSWKSEEKKGRSAQTDPKHWLEMNAHWLLWVQVDMSTSWPAARTDENKMWLKY